MVEDLMRYDLMAQEALRGVMRAALLQAEKYGLPGDHHFFIAFNTTMAGVGMSERLLERYPEEITIVLQHQFWGLEVSEDTFTVELSFDNIPEKLIVPFAAVKGFFDPAVQFGLQFENAEANENIEPETELILSETVTAGLSGPQMADKIGIIDHEHDSEPAAQADNSNIVKLDAFRKK